MSPDEPTVRASATPGLGAVRPEQLSEQRPLLSPEPEGGRKRRRGGRVAAIAGVLAIVLVGAVYITGYLLAGDRLPRNTSMAGIALGGLTISEAVEKLEAEYADEATAPIRVTVGDVTRDIAPSYAGLSVDFPATAEAGGAGKSLAPGHIWRVLTGGGPVAPVVRTDESKLSEAVGALADEVDRPAVDATVAFEGAEITRTPAEQAVEVQRDELAAALRRAYPGTTGVTGEIRLIDPIITDAKADQVVQEYAVPALSGPIKVDTGSGVFTVNPTMIGNASTIENENGRLAGRTDAGELFENAQPAIAAMDLTSARNARYSLEGGNLSVSPSSDGQELTAEAFEEAVMPVLLSSDRSVTAELTVSRATFTTEQAQQQMPTEVIGEFTTSYPHAAYRNTNIGLAASRVNGKTLPVGEVFSLDRTLGNRSTSGYVDGWVVSGSRLKKENAGGVSQAATTVFNAAWFAGLEDVEHQPHTLYFDRYPAGRESTIYSGAIDVKFRNTTDHAVYVQSFSSDSSPGSRGSITVKIWGTKKWDIESPEPRKTGFYSGRTVTDDGPDCNPQAAAPGFTASYYRLFKVNGEVVEREDKSWKYSATDEVTCTRG